MYLQIQHQQFSLTISYDKDFNGQIAIDDLSEFEKFENVVVSTSNPGYALVNGEVIKYEGVDQGKLTTITRGIDSTVKEIYKQWRFDKIMNSMVFLYAE